MTPLPEGIRALFWDCDPASVDMEQHRSFVIRRVLDRGNLEAIRWLRKTVGDAALREWFLQKEGGGMSPRKLRFWGLILDLPRETVDQWVKQVRNMPWGGRLNRRMPQADAE
jgi:hypothetical protein